MQEQIMLSEAYDHRSEIEKAGKYIYCESLDSDLISLVQFSGRPQGNTLPKSNIRWFDVFLIEQEGTTHSVALPGNTIVIVE